MSFFSQAPVYVQLFHFNGNEKNLFIAIKVKWLNLHIGAWLKKAHFRRQFQTALFIFLMQE